MDRLHVLSFLPLLLLSIFPLACSSDILRRQDEIIQEQESEIQRMRKEREELESALKRKEQRRLDCNRAFRYFEQGQAAGNTQEAVNLYRKGLGLCPDDDVAHYELGRIFAGMGRKKEAAREFQAALDINPDLRNAREQLETMEKE